MNMLKADYAQDFIRCISIGTGGNNTSNLHFFSTLLPKNKHKMRSFRGEEGEGKERKVEL